MPRILARTIAVLLCALGLSGMAAAAQIVLYTGPNYEKRQMVITGDVPDLEDYDFEDRVSSMVVVSGIWSVCDRKRFMGTCVNVGPGRYPDLKAAGIKDDAMRSVRLLRDEPPPPPPPPPLADLQRDIDARAAFIKAQGDRVVWRGVSVVIVVVNEGKAPAAASTAVIALSDRMGIDPSYVSVNRAPCDARQFPWPAEGGGAASCRKMSAGDVVSKAAGNSAQCVIPALDPGQTARCMATFSVLYNFLAPMPDEWIVTATVDTGKRVKESNEKNNGAGVDVKVKGDGLPPA
jgi:hypothetical protein